MGAGSKIRLRGYIIRKDDFKVEHLPSRVMIITEGDAKHKRNKWKNIEYYEDPCRVVEDINHFKYRAVAININYDTCDDDISFIIDINMKLELIEISNVFDFLLKVNGECIDINDIENIEFKKGDTLEISTKLLANPEGVKQQPVREPIVLISDSSLE